MPTVSLDFDWERTDLSALASWLGVEKEEVYVLLGGDLKLEIMDLPSELRNLCPKSLLEEAGGLPQGNLRETLIAHASLACQGRMSLTLLREAISLSEAGSLVEKLVLRKVAIFFPDE